MTAYPMLAPPAVLVLWSMIMLMWLVVARFSAFSKMGVDMAQVPPGRRYSDVEKDMPDSANWKSHNWTHLMEQPTLFYAVTIILAISGEQGVVALALAWAYVVLRIIHSFWQALVNVVKIRIRLFAASSLCLLGLSIIAVWRVVL